MASFVDALGPSSRTTILDVGGTPGFWADTEYDITLLNLREPEALPSGMGFVEADATNLPYADGSFGIVFSNSMIEHLHTWERQQEAASEAMRVGERLWIQTPNKWFPVEPHFLTPFVHWLPRRLRRALVRNLTVWGLVTRPSKEYARDVADEIRLLSERELRELFPGCRIQRESFLGLTKSLIVVR